jgi:hypothetical protein
MSWGASFPRRDFGGLEEEESEDSDMIVKYELSSDEEDMHA